MCAVRWHTGYVRGTRSGDEERHLFEVLKDRVREDNYQTINQELFIPSPTADIKTVEVSVFVSHVNVR